MLTSFADRSRVLTMQGCPRKRWFEYEIPTSGSVPGIRPTKLDMNLLTGSAFHMGIQILLNGYSADDAVQGALEGYEDWPGVWKLIREQGLILGENEDASYVAYEQASLVEALIRGYALAVLPGLLERFIVVEVEREDVAQFEIPGFRLNFGMRGDALLMEKDSLDLYVLSLKTAKEHGKRDEDSARHDMQGLSETATVDQRLQGWQKFYEETKDLDIPPGERAIPEWFFQRARTGALPQVMGVKMEFALKGRRSEYPEGSGRWTFSNPLIRPWKKADDLGRGGTQYAVKYEFKDDMGGNHRLGKGWTRINIWEDMGVKNWIEMLASESIQGFQPGYALANQFVLPMEIYRNEHDMERWQRQIVAQEKRVAEGRELVLDHNIHPEVFEEYLDEYFPMHTKSCDWPTRCFYQDVCFGPDSYLHNPISSGLYTVRTPNHKTELSYLVQLETT